ncbi:iron ABC transporter permease [Halobacillus sp. ACCC02827]|uniref:FecCD family ABC transporter permease n=1 Tax=Halobacillus sp. ACCC02827 TaxID=3052090 RepID=UPI00256FEC59|nr:iron ABC transporter permease [Halobacillus sp. ACCC02827]WJE16442.1 iron ABC transporter permease [Halobacillus sp. ACCC02827]
MESSFIQKYLLNKIGWMYILLGGFVLGATLLGVLNSSVDFPIPVVLDLLLNKTLGISLRDETVEKSTELIIWEIRFPRVLLALLVGASLSIAGAAFQGLLRNPLADPYTIGVSSGSALGAVCVLYFQITISFLGEFTLPVVAIISGFITMLIVFGVTHLANRTLAIETIILAGIIVSSFISAVISLIIALSSREDMRQILYWLMGNVGMRGWSHVQLLLPFFVVGVLLLLFKTRELNAMALGEESAEHLGVHVNRGKVMVIVGASLLTGAAVAVSGQIGFVGLVIPHFIRMLVGPNHRHVLPLSTLAGGGYLILADLFARTIVAPEELPIGVITALIGAPIFALLMIRERFRRNES